MLSKNYFPQVCSPCPLLFLLISVISFFLVSGWVLKHFWWNCEIRTWPALHCFCCIFISVIMFSVESSVSCRFQRHSSLSNLVLATNKELLPVSTCFLKQDPSQRKRHFYFFPRLVPIVGSAKYWVIFSFLLILLKCSVVWGVRIDLELAIGVFPQRFQWQMKEGRMDLLWFSSSQLPSHCGGAAQRYSEPWPLPYPAVQTNEKLATGPWTGNFFPRCLLHTPKLKQVGGLALPVPSFPCSASPRSLVHWDSFPTLVLPKWVVLYPAGCALPLTGLI